MFYLLMMILSFSVFSAEPIEPNDPDVHEFLKVMVMVKLVHIKERFGNVSADVKKEQAQLRILHGRLEDLVRECDEKSLSHDDLKPVPEPSYDDLKPVPEPSYDDLKPVPEPSQREPQVSGDPDMDFIESMSALEGCIQEMEEVKKKAKRAKSIVQENIDLLTYRLSQNASLHAEVHHQ